MLKALITIFCLLGTVAIPAATYADELPTPPVTAVGHRGSDGRGSIAAGGDTHTGGQNRSPAYKGHVDRVTVTSLPPTPEQQVEIFNNLCGDDTATVANCTVPTPGLIRTTNPGPTPDQVNTLARQFFTVAELPQPTPEISAKNGGICGVDHSLNLHVPLEKIYTYGNTDFGDVVMHVYGRVKVDWGDGQTGNYTTAGADYPNSDIKHYWTTAGSYNIVATVTWTARITVGPYQGQTYTLDVGGVTTTGAIPNFNVLQAQAVITS